ncbi:sigma-70 family RNA polymerase sigma factor [Myxococcus sp. CA051A]|uniref:Sigma-70 family RNA polymerase sigma factor n=1 Tax=Myxococcus llanfairpwllgwyngyllgogerychwyrndrobwllllantysiliogogogochensis TaxID=2590453 RepID=A0A540WNW8_9BACT|nr:MULTISPECIES: sigma-70 family RNA polymerase sigma factor [Myxococcus]NTX38679.1 sigma-70 family RNA polymerase sigma factor [Myxococcus sp. CA033]NTX62754.1 sigma-70 family RNA polymerase sigma factor [Myxococcus sp. CA051A]TQF10715.1 sigma-70 family RNA polymerase sigma factor [Myxococcus llanfairpwllgwyngyllgogerychwyrndrobwllllantysiliogogogochensis]
MSFPSQAEEQALHERVLKKNESLASQDVFRVFMAPITRVLCRNRRKTKEEAHDAVCDVLMEYLENPERYLAHKSKLSSYLTRNAEMQVRDMYRSQEARQRREREFGEAIELRATAPNRSLEIIVEARHLVGQLEQAIQEQDRAALGLILQGERSTDALAKAMNLPQLSEKELRREVKRNRDRLMKTLGRIGKEE